MKKNANAYAAIQVIVLIAVLFMGYWVIAPIFGQIYNKFTDDTDFNERYPTEESCYKRGYWNGTHCSQVGETAQGLMQNQRRTWLAVPFIFVFGLILWYWTTASKKDYQQYGGP